VESSLQRISSNFFVMETKRFVGSTVNVMLTRQTCGQQSSKAAKSKRRALGNYVSGRICYMFLISKCKGSRSVYNFGTCVWRTEAQRRLPEKNVLRRRKNQNLSLRCGWGERTLNKSRCRPDLDENWIHSCICTKNCLSCNGKFA